jgi:hypothetical protein
LNIDPKNALKPLKCYLGNTRWRQNKKWRPLTIGSYFAAKWPIFNEFPKNIVRFIGRTSIYKSTLPCSKSLSEKTRFSENRFEIFEFIFGVTSY